MKIIVSACLAGIPCRFDGSAKPGKLIVSLYKDAKVIPICPESFSGLPNPRPPAEQLNGKVYNKCGKDVTQEFERGAARALVKALKFNSNLAILKARSPSCGVNYIYDGSFTKTLCKGHGIFTKKLLDKGFQVIDEEHIDEEYLARYIRDNF